MKLFGTVFITSQQQTDIENCLNNYDEFRDYTITKTSIPTGTKMSKKLTINVKGEQDKSLLESIFKHDLHNDIEITTNFEMIAERLLIEFMRFTKDRMFHYLSIWIATVGAIYLAFYSAGFLGHDDLTLYIHIEIIFFAFIPSGAELLNQFNQFKKGRLDNNL